MDQLSRPMGTPDEDPAETENSGLPFRCQTALKKPLTNTSGLQTYKGYVFPEVEDTKCQKLDWVIKQNLSKEANEADAGI